MHAQKETDRLIEEIKNAEEAKNRQRQAENFLRITDSGEDPTEIIVEDMFNPEQEIQFVPPTPGAITELDLERNEEECASEMKKAESDPTTKLGGAP